MEGPIELVFEILSWFLLLGGSAIVLIGTLGLLRLPDVFARMHGAGMTDTLGAGMILGGLAVQSGLSLVSFKLFLILAFLLFTSPVSTHAVARAALAGGQRPLVGGKPDEAETDTAARDDDATEREGEATS